MIIIIRYSSFPPKFRYHLKCVIKLVVLIVYDLFYEFIAFDAFVVFGLHIFLVIIVNFFVSIKMPVKSRASVL